MCTTFKSRYLAKSVLAKYRYSTKKRDVDVAPAVRLCTSKILFRWNPKFYSESVKTSNFEICLSSCSWNCTFSRYLKHSSLLFKQDFKIILRTSLNLVGLAGILDPRCRYYPDPEFIAKSTIILNRFRKFYNSPNSESEFSAEFEKQYFLSCFTLKYLYLLRHHHRSYHHNRICFVHSRICMHAKFSIRLVLF